MPDNIMLQEHHGDVLVLTFNHAKPQNPFSEVLQDNLMDALKVAEEDETVNAVVLYGGNGRSFSVGGDFSEVVQLGDPVLIGSALSKVVDLYIAILKLSKPLIVAVDHYAIGMGFQVAILADYRVGTEQTTFIMPELKNGVACTLGCAMTEYLYGRFIMQEICYESNKIPAKDCLKWMLINEIVETSALLNRAITKAHQYGNFPARAFRGTKRVNNLRFIDVLEKARQHTIDVHVDVFINKEHKSHMEKILKKKP